MAGPLEGATFVLSGQEVGIGRDPTNQICLSDPPVSRRHCVIAQDHEQFLLRDLDSSNGTFVNDVPIRERLLAENDRIKIGDTLFLFLLSETEAARSTTDAHFDDVSVVTSSTFIVEMDQAKYLQPEKVNEALPASDRIARDLNALLKISATINQIRRTDELRRRLLELILEVIPAERGAILLDKNIFNVAEPIFRIDRTGGEDSQFKLSRTIVDQVRREGVAILSNDVEESVTLRVAPSLIVSHIRSLLAVPIMLDKQALGIIYLDSSDPQVDFDEDHLQLVSAIAGLAAVALDNVRQWEWLAGEAKRLRAEINLDHDMIGESAQMKSVYQMISKVAPSDSTVLILGESGTGKELAARAIHRSSPRVDKPFIAINCAGLSETLIESDLFGHEKGSYPFTGVEKTL
jgi:transcriptional regulator with GAF, ATPase, and Fis domain